MKVVYLSASGNTRYFAERTQFELVEVHAGNTDITVDEDYVMIVPTYEPVITDPLRDFLEFNDNGKKCKGLIGNGNLNFGEHMYIYTAKNISSEFNIPILFDYELAGNQHDLDVFIDIVNNV